MPPKVTWQPPNSRLCYHPKPKQSPTRSLLQFRNMRLLLEKYQGHPPPSRRWTPLPKTICSPVGSIIVWIHLLVLGRGNVATKYRPLQRPTVFGPRTRFDLRRTAAPSSARIQATGVTLLLTRGKLGQGCRIDPPISSRLWPQHDLGRQGLSGAPSGVALDCAPISIGDRTILGPGGNSLRATHPLNPLLQYPVRQFDFAMEIHIGKDCWLGGGVVVWLRGCEDWRWSDRVTGECCYQECAVVRCCRRMSCEGCESAGEGGL